MAELIKRVRKYGAIILVLLLWTELTALPPVHAAGVTYYVDAVNGSDSNSGLSEGDAWKSAQKVAATALNAGDAVLFHAGQTFYQVYIAPNCDSLTFGAYGDGDRPVLSGGALCGPWETCIGNIYQQRIVLENAPYLLKIGDKTYRKQTTESYTQTEAGKFSYDEANGILYVNEPAGIAEGADTQVQQTDHIFYISEKKYIKIQGLYMMMTSSAAVNIQSAKSQYITVDNNEIAYAESCKSNGSGINGSSIKNSTFSNNLIHNVYGDGILLWNAEGNTIAGNRIWGIKRGKHTDGDGIQCAGKMGNAAPNNKIIDNFVSMKDTDVGKGCIQQENGDNVYIARNVCLYGSFGIEANSNYGIVEDNICAYQGTQATQAGYNWTAGLYMSENEDITGMVWRGNIVSNTRPYGFRIIGSGTENGVTQQYKRTGFKIYNNTIYSNGTAFSAAVPFDGRIYNNIFYNSKEGKTGAVFSIGKVTEGQSVLSDNNMFYPERTGFIAYCGTGYDSMGVYQSITGLELESYAEDPLLYGAKAGFSVIPVEEDFTVYANSKAVSGGRSIKQGVDIVYPVGCNIGAVQTSRADAFHPDTEPPAEEEVKKPVFRPGLLAYDGFDYPPASALDGMDGGAGFDGAWYKAVETTVSAAVGTSGLKHPGIYVTGYKALIESFQERAIENPGRFVNGTYYISFLFQGNAKFQISVRNPDGSRKGWIYVQNTAKKNWQICSSTDTKPKPAPAGDDTEGLALIQLKIGDNKTEAALWINPDLSGGEEGLGTPILKDTAAVRVIPEVISVGPADTSGKIQIDEIRIGSNLDAVLGQTSIYPEQFTVTEQGLYSNGAAIGESVAAGTPVEARLTMANTPDKDREVTLYAAAKLNGTLLDICMEIYKIKAGATEQIEFPIDFSGLTAQRYEVSLFSWEGMRPLCKQYEYMVE